MTTGDNATLTQALVLGVKRILGIGDCGFSGNHFKVHDMIGATLGIWKQTDANSTGAFKVVKDQSENQQPHHHSHRYRSAGGA